MTTPGLPAIIIPIHNAVEDLDRCLDALYSHTPKSAPVLLLDDASDDSRISPLLIRWSEHVGPAWRLEHNDRNLGFVGTANRGMQMTQTDVVLLNSDTLVTPGWLEGLARCLRSDPKIATATPWTNNGEIASLPALCQVNPVPRNLSEVGELIRKNVNPHYPEIPTAVGFCMAISRYAINRLGLFDEKAFGLGYGEENDFSMRARKAGLRNVLCDNVYVAHVGGRSFEPRGIRPGPQAMETLLERHPGYLELVREFISEDPLSVHRSEVISVLRSAGIELS